MATDDPALAAVDAHIQKEKIDTKASGWRTKLKKPPQLEFTPKKKYFWLLQTNHGDLKIRLMPDVAPMHVSSTLFLTRLGYFDGLAFHRVIPDFMAQGGCPLGTGTGGPGYQYHGEFHRDVKHDKPGLLSMANAGPGTDGSQFFLTFVATPWLDGKHTIFGEVVDGAKTLKELEKRGSKPAGKPTAPITLVKATVAVE
jgi:cyclophilin family peptidyl-prolyl cis-trans isomerase